MDLTDEEEALSKEYFENGLNAKRPCELLVAGGSNRVGVWKSKYSGPFPHWISIDFTSFDSGLEIDGVLHVFSDGIDTECTLNSVSPEYDTGTPLGFSCGDSLPHPDEDWDAIEPSGYMDWLGRMRSSLSPLEVSERARAVLESYNTYYRSHDPLQNQEDLVAMIGGWGTSIYEGEWSAFPEATPILFTLRDSEPWISIRRTSEGIYESKAIIT